MLDFGITLKKNQKARVIINTDAKNEADDQFAIVHAILTPSFELHGIIPAHFGEIKSKTSQKDSYDETMHLLNLMGLEGKIRVENGAAGAIADEHTPVDSPGARLIISEAMKDDDRPLYVAFYGPLTDMASALLLEPKIADRNVIVVWIGGTNYRGNRCEFNLSNDIAAANVVFKSKLQVWQVPSTVYRQVAVSYAELMYKVYPQGEIGKYLVKQLMEFNARYDHPFEFRSLGDSPAVGVIMYPDLGEWDWKPAPEFDEKGNYIETGANRPIRVYSSIDARFIHEDFFAKLALFVKANNL